MERPRGRWHAAGVGQRRYEGPGRQDPAYDPAFSDFNLVIDNHGSAVNVFVPRATVTIKFRYSARIDPMMLAKAHL